MIWTLASLYLLLMVLLHIPAVQGFIGSQVSCSLGKMLGTEVQVGRVDLGFLNRIIIDDVVIYDQSHRKMIQASRLSGKIDLIPLLTDNRISISSAQLFGLNADFYKQTAETKPNFQFALDSLASKDSTAHKPLNLQIQSLVIRHGAVKYNEWDAPQTPRRLNLKHLELTNLSTHINLYTLTDDSISINVKKLSLKEKAGLDVRKLRFKLNAGKLSGKLSDFQLALPESHLDIPHAEVSYHMKDGTVEKSSIRFNANLKESKITPSDLACLTKELENFRNPIFITASTNGNASSLHVNGLHVSSSTGSISLKGNGHIEDWNKTLKWDADLEDLQLSAEGLQFVAKNLNGERIRIPEEVIRMGNIRFKGHAQGLGNAISSSGNLRTDAGDVQMKISINGSNFNGDVKTGGFNLARILNDNTFGQVIADIKAEGTLKGHGQQAVGNLPVENLMLKGNVDRFDYNGYTYHRIFVDGNINGNLADGKFIMDDPHGKVELNGVVNLSKQSPSTNITASVRHFNPQALKLTNVLGNRTLDFDAKADFSGNTLARANGYLHLENLQTSDGKSQLHINNIDISTGYQDDEHFIDLQSDFGNILIRGKYDYKTLAQSFINIANDKMPSLPGLPHHTAATNNDFAIIANIFDTALAQNLFGIPVELHEPLHMKGVLNDRDHELNLDINAPHFTYDGKRFEDAHVYFTTHNDTLFTRTVMRHIAANGRRLALDLDGYAADNKLVTTLKWDASQVMPLKGVLTAETEFSVNENGKDVAHIRVLPSEVILDRKTLTVQPSDIIYSKNSLQINHFQLSNNNQHIIIHGKATPNPEDSLTVNLRDIDVGYVLDLVNFHSVDFSGLASGHATLRDIFGNLKADAAIDVKDFRFENGRMGVLHAQADFMLSEGNINIHAVADDAPGGKTLINGYVSPVHNNLDLHIGAEGTPLEFIEDYCRSFMGNITARAQGNCRVFGNFNNVNLEGQLVANGGIYIKTLNTAYTLHNDTIKLIPDEIIFQNDTVYDRNRNTGVVTGALHHQHLTKMTFDINVEADNLLAYDMHNYNGQSFYGTVYGTGTCYIMGRKGAITFDINATPNSGSFIEYNAGGPEGISKGDFITWTPGDQLQYTHQTPHTEILNSNTQNKTLRPASSDIRLNFLVNVTPDFTLRILMDENTGDKILLNGNGVLRANYFNKGSFDMFGNYLIDYGTYTMTIQNVIKKVFTFQSGSTITFGGDPFNATLNMKGQYTVPSVSLSDLQMGRSFTQNSIRVNCLMNIGGTAGSPNVTFDLDLPTLSTDAQQMERSVINSEEDMNQQVLYLLAVGRFLPQGSNNATQDGTEQQNQTSLAMQSLLSGTLSQQPPSDIRQERL